MPSGRRYFAQWVKKCPKRKPGIKGKIQHFKCDKLQNVRERAFKTKEARDRFEMKIKKSKKFKLI